MARILVADGMEAEAIAQLKSKGYEVVEQFYEVDELKEQLKNFDVLSVRSATKVREPVIDVAAAAGTLKLIVRGGVGVDNIDVAYAESKGIKVRNTPAASSISVAELAIGHMFALARFIGISNYTMRKGEWNKKKYEGIELGGKTLGLVGFGRIAQEVAKRAAALGMSVIYTDIVGENKNYPNFKFCSFDDVLKNADFISLHVPAPKDKKAMFDKAEFAKMKDGSYIINTARGILIDEAALIDALDSGKLAGAGLDVFAEEPPKNEKIYMHDKISLTPHIGGSTAEAQGRIGQELVDIITELVPAK